MDQRFDIEPRTGTQQTLDGESQRQLGYKVKSLSLSPPRPRNQSSPVHTSMSDSEPFDTSDSLTLNLQHRIGMTHGALAQKVNAMPHICRSNRVSNLMFTHDSTGEGRFDEHLVAFAGAVLYVFPTPTYISVP